MSNAGRRERVRSGAGRGGDGEAIVAGAGQPAGDRRGRGRPPREIERLPATAEEIAAAMFRAADTPEPGADA